MAGRISAGFAEAVFLGYLDPLWMRWHCSKLRGQDT